MRFVSFFWLKWNYLGLNKNHFWFFNFEDEPSILDIHFKF
jgi:hypothetical protein